MKKLYLIHYILSFPILLLHELSHIIVATLFFKRITKINFDINKNDKGKYNYQFIIKYSRINFKLTNILISVAPLFMTIGLFIFAYYNITLLYFLIPYFLIYYKLFFPSKTDINSIKYNILTDEEQLLLILNKIKND